MRRLLAVLMSITVVLSGCSFGKDKEIEGTKYSPQSVTKEAGIITVLDLESCSPLLIQNGAYTILVDTGDDGSYSKLQSELNSRSITAIDCLIITSPLKYRTGSASKVLKDYNVRQVLQPRWSAEVKSSTANYIDFTQQLQIKSTPVTYTSYGFSAMLGSVKLTALGPQGDVYKDSDNFSMICKFQFGMVSMIYMSGAYGPSEQELVSGRITVKSDILMLGTLTKKESNQTEFIETINPGLVIAPRESKSPKTEVIESFTDRNIELHRVSDHGNIVITTDGKNIGLTSDYYQLSNTTEETVNETSNLQ